MAQSIHYKRAMDYLNKRQAFFAVMVTNLGQPIIDNSIAGYVEEDTEFHDKGEPIYNTPTLQVEKREDEDTFRLVINEEYLKGKTDAEVAGLLAHEAFHIIFSHLSEAFITKDKDEVFKKKQILAHELICNDNVINEGLRLPDTRRVSKITGELAGGLLFGPDIVGRDVAQWTTKEVMDLIPDNHEFIQNMPSENQDHFIMLSPSDLQKLKEQISKDIRHKVFTGQLDPDKINSSDIKNILKINQTSTKPGSSKTRVQTRFEKAGASVNWFKYLKNIDPNAFRGEGTAGEVKTSYEAIGRRHTALLNYGVRLPVYRPRISSRNIGLLRPSIVLALDFSGSVPRHLQEVMGRLARLVPDSIEIQCCTFSEEFVPFDHKLDGTQDTASGGTNFSAIQDFIESIHLKRQPYVVAITDGGAGWRRNRPPQEVLDRYWNWLLLNKGDKFDAGAGHIEPRTVKYLNDYLLK